MRQPLMWVLAVVLGLTLWLSMQDDDAALPAARQRDPAAARGDGRPPAPGAEPAVDRPSNERPAPDRARAAAGTASAPSADDARLLAAVVRWQHRVAASGPAPGQTPGSAWRAVVPPPPPPPPETAPPPPQAPPFPHRWIGRFEDTVNAASAPRARQRAIVAGPVSTWVVSEGELIEGQWRVDRIEDRTLRLTYLPLMQAQTTTMR